MQLTPVKMSSMLAFSEKISENMVNDRLFNTKDQVKFPRTLSHFNLEVGLFTNANSHLDFSETKRDQWTFRRIVFVSTSVQLYFNISLW